MAREDSTQTLQASQEFRDFLNALPLHNAWTDHTWKSNAFKAKKDNGHFLIEYKEYRTNQTVGTYTFDRKGKLVYYLTHREKIQQVVSNWLFLPIGLLVLTLWLALPIAALGMISAHPQFSLPYSLIPYILCLIGILFCALVVHVDGTMTSKTIFPMAIGIDILTMLMLFQYQFHFVPSLQTIFKFFK